MFLENSDTVITVGYVTLTMLALFFAGLGLFIWKDSRP